MNTKLHPDKISNEINFWKVLAYGFAIVSVGTAIAIIGFILTSK
jgi:hypothetical protein